jgi:hypothetical protein
MRSLGDSGLQSLLPSSMPSPYLASPALPDLIQRLTFFPSSLKGIDQKYLQVCMGAFLPTGICTLRDTPPHSAYDFPCSRPLRLRTHTLCSVQEHPCPYHHIPSHFLCTNHLATHEPDTFPPISLNLCILAYPLPLPATALPSVHKISC